MSYTARALNQFHKTYEITNDQKQKDLRVHLIEEEFNEVRYELLKETLNKGSLAKELSDLIYVIYGTALVFDIDLDIAFEQVHLSNMSKLDENGEVIRRDDGKVLKGTNYFEPDMSKAIK
jgi:NTP pyrophosphatase (non-canonical NTP hydrolase)